MYETVLQFCIMVGIGALIGWTTNVVAIRLLFRPHNVINIFGFKLHGVIPKRKSEIAERIARTIDSELISIKDITEKLKDIDIESEIDGIVHELVTVKLKEEIIAKFPMASFFINDSLILKIKEYIKEIIMERRHEITAVIGRKLENEIDFQEIVREKIENFSLVQLEKIILTIAKRELTEIELMGGILGALIGILQFALTKVI